jgi:hypothetical protein
MLMRQNRNEEHWKNSLTSAIFICYAYNELGKGGNEGSGDVDSKTINELTKVFEDELVNKIDKILKLKFTAKLFSINA